MTREEKAKAYDIALARAREIHRNEDDKVKDMEFLFPELADSKDERIRKEIIEFLIYTNKYGSNEKCESWIAWLENQKPTEWSEEDNTFFDELESYITYDEGFSEEQKEWRINRLKSLKPQNRWKPSDAQMASITCAVRNMKESACYDSELVSLLNDLKKL